MSVQTCERELVRSAFRVAKSMRDADGRCLGEGNAPADCVASMSIEWRTCPYHDSRQGHAKPMNVTALRQVLDYWNDLLALLAQISAAYRRRFDCQTATAADVFSVSFMVTMLPAYYVTRGVWSADAVPIAVGAAYKTCAGVFQAISHALVTRLADGASPDLTLSPAEIMAHADAHGIFESRQGVCAGPPKQIVQLLATLSEEHVEDAVAAGASLPDLDGFFAYAAGAIALEQAKSLFAISTAFGELCLLEALQRSPAIVEASPELAATARQLASAAAGRGWHALLAGRADAAYARLSSFVWAEIVRFGGDAAVRLDPPFWPHATPAELQETMAAGVRLEDACCTLFARLQRRIDDVMAREPDTSPIDRDRLTAIFGEPAWRIAAGATAGAAAPVGHLHTGSR